MLRIALVALGVAMVLVALAWRARDLRRRSGGVEAALRSSDPVLRMRALRGIASVGLRPWSAMLLQRTREVGDGVEADELVWLIGACQWEPADDPAIVQLRLWAAGRMEGAPKTANATNGATPAPPEPEPRLHLAPEPPPADPEPEPEPRVPMIHVVAPPEAPPAPPVDVAPLFAAVLPVVDVAPEAPAVEELPGEVRPAIVEEIEAIVGARVLALNFVPLAQSGS